MIILSVLQNYLFWLPAVILTKNDTIPKYHLAIILKIGDRVEIIWALE